MYEAKKSIRQGSIDTVYAQSSVSRGVLTLESGATFTLYDSTGAIVSGFEDVAITGNSDSPSNELLLWYLLDTSTLSQGVYVGLFKYNITSSLDALNRRDRPGVQLTILAPVEVAATWSLSTNIGKTRFYLGDRRQDKPIWADEEIDFLLTQNSNPILAAAIGYDVAAGQESYLALYDQVQLFRVDRRGLPAALRAQADRLRELYATQVSAAGAGGSVNSDVIEIFPATSEGDEEASFGRPYGVLRTAVLTTEERMRVTHDE